MIKPLPKRKKESHKGDHGKVLVIAGSRGMLGAGVLATRAAFRTGSGLVYWAVPDDLVNFANTITPEVIVISHSELDKIKPDAVAIGPGLDPAFDFSSFVHRPSSLVVDASALQSLVRHPDLLKPLAGRAIITPHPGELSRLLSKSVDAIQADRKGSALAAAAKFGTIVVLKGHQSVIADPSGKTVFNKIGNPGMATAGSGDVLTGIIASLVGQGLSAWDAAVTGVYLHGSAGNIAAGKVGEHSLIASDIIWSLPDAIQKIR
jgi:ADP-dependent NAD(P)H-hydrate dehydratase / NAD(P)H-hydrate epimerase